MQFVTKKIEKVDQCNSFQDEIVIELYEKLLGLKERFQLKLDLHRFEEQCFEINNTLIEQGYFLKVFEAKRKHNFNEKRQRKTVNEARNISSCIRPKF